MSSRPAMSLWVEHLQSQDRYSFTRTQAEAETERSFVAAQTALRRLKKQGRIVSPRRGFYVIVPPEYRATASPPASWFIDELMRYLEQPYYVGLLSAAAIHGAAHQQPMVFQVLTSKPTREMRAGKVAIQFSMSSKVEQMPVSGKQTETGTMPGRCPSGSIRGGHAPFRCGPENLRTSRSTRDGTSCQMKSWSSTIDTAREHHGVAYPRPLAVQ